MKKLTVLLPLLFWWWFAYADHLFGGELRYTLLDVEPTTKTYRIQLLLYADCHSFYRPPANPAVNIANSNFYQKLELKATSQAILPDAALAGCAINPPGHCVEVFRYEGLVTLKNGNEGYHLFYSDCCRDEMSVNLKMDGVSMGVEDQNGLLVPGQGLTITAFISTDLLNSSPVLVTDSTLRLCANEPFSFRYQYSDPDGDSLSFSFDTSLGVINQTLPNYTPVNYATGNSALQPVPGRPPLTLTTAGLLAGTPTQAGSHTIVILITEFRNGRPIAKHRRDEQIIVSACDIQPAANQFRCDTSLVSFTTKNNPQNLFHWDFGVSASDSDTSSKAEPSFVYPQDGDFMVTLIVSNPSTGCRDTVTSGIKISRGLTADFSWNGPICNGQPLVITDQSRTTTGAITSRQWRLVNNNTRLGTAASFQYNYRVPNNDIQPLTVELSVENSLGCKRSVQKVVEIYPQPIANAGPDTTLAPGLAYTMQGSGGLTYHWQPATGLSNPRTATPVLLHNRDQDYRLIVSSNGVCSDTDLVRVRYVKGPDIYIPTAFTPNGDGVNDFYTVTPVHVQLRRFAIYNRWGQEVYAASGKPRWDGRWQGMPQPAGTFVWQCEGIDARGAAFTRKGTFQLIR